MRTLIILISLTFMLSCPAEAKRQEIVVEYIGVAARAWGYEEHAFMSQDNTLYSLLFCDDIDPEQYRNRKFCNSGPDDDEKPALKKRAKRFDIIRDTKEYIGYQMIITAEKTEKSSYNGTNFTKVLAYGVKLDTRKNAPRYTKISSLQTITGKIQWRHSTKNNSYDTITTINGKKYEFIISDFEEEMKIEEGKYYTFEGYLLFYYKPFVFNAVGSATPYRSKR